MLWTTQFIIKTKRLFAGEADKIIIVSQLTNLLLVSKLTDLDELFRLMSII